MFISTSYLNCTSHKAHRGPSLLQKAAFGIDTAFLLGVITLSTLVILASLKQRLPLGMEKTLGVLGPLGGSVVGLTGVALSVALLFTNILYLDREKTKKTPSMSRENLKKNSPPKIASSSQIAKKRRRTRRQAVSLPPTVDEQKPPAKIERTPNDSPTIAPQDITEPPLYEKSVEEVQPIVKEENLPPPTLQKAIINRDRIDEAYKTEKGDLRQKKAFKVLKEKHPDDPFLKAFESQLKGNADITYKTDDHIFSPNKAALQAQADHYKTKYGISIYLVKIGELKDKIKEWSATIEKPTYIGVISSPSIEQDKPGDQDYVHVTPLLFYFPGKGLEEEPQCIVMDSAGEIGISRMIGRHQLMPIQNLYTASGFRQVDNYSCRTGALILLRNALLSLKYNKAEGGFHTFLIDNADIEKIGNHYFINALPPEWDYSEQITNPRLKDNEKVPDIRRHFSAKNKPNRTASQHRKDHTKNRTFAYEAAEYRVRLVIDPSIQPPSGIQFYTDESMWKLNFSVTYPVNTYLLEKGKKMADKVKNQG